MTGQRFFITGTDTGVGKTLVASQLCRKLVASGFDVVALKPVAAGAIEHRGERVNEDVLALDDACGGRLSPGQINPFLLEQPIAPHIAAEQQAIRLDVANCLAACEPVFARRADYLVIEGAGGWQVPLNDRETMADLAVAMRARVILTVGMRLGCLSHALLTAESIAARGAGLAGWVANCIDPEMPFCSENIATLERRLEAPMIAQIPYLPERGCDGATRYFDLDKLLSR